MFCFLNINFYWTFVFDVFDYGRERFLTLIFFILGRIFGDLG